MGTAICRQPALTPVRCIAYRIWGTSFIHSASDLEEETTAFVRAQIIERKSEIIKRINKEFPARGFNITDVADFHSSVDEVRVTHVDLEDDDFDVIEVSDDSATVTAAVHISYEADLEYGNEETASYDHEDGYMFWDRVNKTVEREDDFGLQISVVFDNHDPESFEIGEVYLDVSDTVEIDADDGWPHK